MQAIILAAGLEKLEITGFLLFGVITLRAEKGIVLCIEHIDILEKQRVVVSFFFLASCEHNLAVLTMR